MLQKLHFFTGVSGQVGVLPSSVVAIIRERSADGRDGSLLFLLGAHKLWVLGDVSDVYNELINSQ